MKKILIFMFISFVMNALHSQTEVTVDATISSVRIYQTRAEVTEVATQTLNPGSYLLVFTGLSRFMDAQSIGASGKGDGIIQSVTHRLSYLNRTPKTAKMLALEDSIKKFNEYHEDLVGERFVYEKEEELILKNDKLASEKQALTTDELIKLTNFYRNRLNEIRIKIRSLLRKESLNSKELTKMVQELKMITAGRDQPTNQVVVAYQAKSATKITVEIKYLVSNARWVPSYDIRAGMGNETDKITLNMKANILNNTGVDWKNVKLTLSSGDPASRSNAPVVNPWYVRIYTNSPGYNSSSRGAYKKEAAKADVDDMASGAGADTEEINDEEKPAPPADLKTSADYTKSSETGLTYEYEIAIKYDIPADGQVHQADIQGLKLGSSYRYYAVPRLDKDAFLQAEITGWEAYNLLPGNSNVYFDGAFVGETFIDPSNTRDTLHISLGRDARVIVKREPIREYASKKLIGLNIKQTLGYQITVRNTRKEEINITIEDQIPISTSSDIEVVLTDKSSNPIYDEITGKLTWKMNLGSNSSKSVKFQFEVKYPKSKRIMGL